MPHFYRVQHLRAINEISVKWGLTSNILLWIILHRIESSKDMPKTRKANWKARENKNFAMYFCLIFRFDCIMQHTFALKEGIFLWFYFRLLFSSSDWTVNVLRFHARNIRFFSKFLLDFEVEVLSQTKNISEDHKHAFQRFLEKLYYYWRF